MFKKKVSVLLASVIVFNPVLVSFAEVNSNNSKTPYSVIESSINLVAPQLLQ